MMITKIIFVSCSFMPVNMILLMCEYECVCVLSATVLKHSTEFTHTLLQKVWQCASVSVSSGCHDGLQEQEEKEGSSGELTLFCSLPVNQSCKILQDTVNYSCRIICFCGGSVRWWTTRSAHVASHPESVCLFIHSHTHIRRQTDCKCLKVK